MAFRQIPLIGGSSCCYLISLALINNKQFWGSSTFWPELNFHSLDRQHCASLLSSHGSLLLAAMNPLTNCSDFIARTTHIDHKLDYVVVCYPFYITMIPGTNHGNFVKGGS